MENNFLSLLLIVGGVILILMLLGAFKQNCEVNGYRRRGDKSQQGLMSGGGYCSGYACPTVWGQASNATTCCENCDSSCSTRNSASCKAGCNCQFGVTCSTGGGKQNQCVDFITDEANDAFTQQQADDTCDDLCEYNTGNQDCSAYTEGVDWQYTYASGGYPCQNDYITGCNITDVEECKAQCKANSGW
jgi:hypothetical protein